MAKIESSDLHKTPGGKGGYLFQLQTATQCVRQHVAELRGCRTRDMFASGAIHALALLASDVPKRGLPVTEKEVDYWSETFFGWFNSVKQHFPEPLRAEFQEKAEADFAVIREKANTFSETPWEQLKDTIERPVRFKDRDTFDRALEAAKTKYPVKLGIALDKYLLACVQRLLSDDNPDAPLVVNFKEGPPEDKPGTVAPRFVTFDDGTHSLLVTSFGGLGRLVQSGLGLEKAVRAFLRKRQPQLLNELNFDSESSMFCVRSNSVQSLAVVSEAIFTIAAEAKRNATS